MRAPLALYLCLLLSAARFCVSATDRKVQCGDQGGDCGVVTDFKSHDEYVASQLSKTSTYMRGHNTTEHLSNFVREPHIRALAEYIKANVTIANKFGLCHGTRSGREQIWFRRYLKGVEVLGTELSAEAAKASPHTRQWDFHERNPEWTGKCDFVYSNALDHSYDPALALSRWMEQVAAEGALFLEWHDKFYGPRARSRFDPFGTTKEQLSRLVDSVGAMHPNSFHLADHVDFTPTRDELASDIESGIGGHGYLTPRRWLVVRHGAIRGPGSHRGGHSTT